MKITNMIIVIVFFLFITDVASVELAIGDYVPETAIEKEPVNLSLTTEDETACPGKERVLEGYVHEISLDNNLIGPLPNVEVNISSECGFDSFVVMADNEGKFSAIVKGPVLVRVANLTEFSGWSDYVHNFRNDSHVYAKRGRSIYLYIFGSSHSDYPRARVILDCDDGKVRTTTENTIIVQKGFEKCKLVVHDNVHYYEENIDFSSVNGELNLALDKEIGGHVLPDLTANSNMVVINLSIGWNLISNTIFYDRNDVYSTCLFDNLQKTLAYYDPIKKQYVYGVYYERNLDNLTNGEAEMYEIYSRTGSSWVYSYTQCQAGIYFKERYRDLTNVFAPEYLKLYTGWNFRFITDDMVNKTFNEIKGNCDIKADYYFDTSGNAWQRIYPDETLTMLFKGFIIKVSDDCMLDPDPIAPLPQLPED